MASAVRQIQISASMVGFVARVRCRRRPGSNLSGAAGQVFNTLLRNNAGRRVETRLPASCRTLAANCPDTAALAAPSITGLSASLFAAGRRAVRFGSVAAKRLAERPVMDGAEPN